MVAKTEIVGVGPHKTPVIHSLRKTLINNLMRAGFTAAEITLRTGHKNVQSVQSYANIQGESGKRQQSALIRNDEPGNSSKRPRTVDRESDTLDISTQNAISSMLSGVTNNGSMVINFNINKP